jgi:hypothetical protein
MHKTLTALAAAAAMTLAVVAVPDQADARWRGGHRGYGGGVAAGVLGGLAAGAILGGIAAGQGYYGPGYYGSDYYGPGYDYGGPYAYEPAPVYIQPVPRAYRGGGCWIVTDKDRGYGYYGACR